MQYNNNGCSGTGWASFYHLNKSLTYTTDQLTNMATSGEGCHTPILCHHHTYLRGWQADEATDSPALLGDEEWRLLSGLKQQNRSSTAFKEWEVIDTNMLCEQAAVDLFLLFPDHTLCTEWLPRSFHASYHLLMQSFTSAPFELSLYMQNHFSTYLLGASILVGGVALERRGSVEESYTLLCILDCLGVLKCRDGL